MRARRQSELGSIPIPTPTPIQTLIGLIGNHGLVVSPKGAYLFRRPLATQQKHDIGKGAHDG